MWTDDEGELGSPGFVMDHVEGETIARRILREDDYADARRVMAAQCGEILARIHAITASDLPGLTYPDRTATDMVLEQYTQLLDSFGEPHPAFELALRWLGERRPPSERVTLVHGDFRNGNLIVGPDGVRAVLDWELVHLGDPWEDLAWVCMRSWRFGGPGEVGGFGDREDLYVAYERASGLPVDRDAVTWWEIMSSVKWGIMTIGQAFTHLLGHVPSLELAAIGRRTVENEYDVLQLIKPSTGVGGVRGGAVSPPDQLGARGSAQREELMQDRPTAIELLKAAQEFCERDLQPNLTGRVRFHARVLQNVLGILEREWAGEEKADS